MQQFPGRSPVRTRRRATVTHPVFLLLAAVAAGRLLAVDVPLGELVRYDAAPAGSWAPFVIWRWSAAQKEAAATFTRREIVPDPERGGRHVLRLEVTPAFPWAGAPERLVDLGSAYFPPTADAVVLRLRVLSGSFTVGVGGPTAYFGDSDVLTAPQRLEPGAWQDLRGDLHARLCRNYRRAGAGRAAQAIAYNRWAQEPPGLYVLPGSAGVLLLESVTVVAAGIGLPFPACEPRELAAPSRAELAPASAFTLLLADSRKGYFESSWREPAACRYPPPRLSAVAGPTPQAGPALAATACWMEEMLWAGARLGPADGAAALALQVRARPATVSTQLASRAGQPVDLALLAAKPGTPFPWTRLAAPAEWTRAATQPGYGVDFCEQTLQAATNLSVGLYHARRFVQPGQWETLVVPLADFVCISASGELRPDLASRAAPAPDGIAGAAWMLPWPRQGRAADGTLEVCNVRLVGVADPATARRSYPAPRLVTLQPLPGFQGGGGWVQADR